MAQLQGPVRLGSINMDPSEKELPVQIRDLNAQVKTTTFVVAWIVVMNIDINLKWNVITTMGRNKKLLVAKGITTRNKNATRGSWPY